MNIYLTRHGQTHLNRKELMQGRTDAPLNEKGIMQAENARQFIKDVHFDAVYSSPLIRAKQTASIMSDTPMEDLIIDPRIIEVEFGDYELRKYNNLGLKLTSYWLLPEVFKCPDTVEPLEKLIERSHAFLRDLEKKDYENVLVVCHGGIIRPMCGYLLDKKRGFQWRPKPHNCEIRLFESNNGKHKFIKSFKQ
ncbi:MAG: histidine phosphatase family protein [Lachnospiraceae bacterium]|nr:histidine phosphatase family protein [Lachnospiraceae bacterium]